MFQLNDTNTTGTKNTFTCIMYRGRIIKTGGNDRLGCRAQRVVISCSLGATARGWGGAPSRPLCPGPCPSRRIPGSRAVRAAAARTVSACSVRPRTSRATARRACAPGCGARSARSGRLLYSSSCCRPRPPSCSPECVPAAHQIQSQKLAAFCTGVGLFH